MSSKPAQGIRSFLRPLRNPNFRWMWIAQIVSIIGDFFSFLAVPYLITVLAQEAVVLAPLASKTGILKGLPLLTSGGDMSPEAKTLVGLATMAFTLPRLFGIFTGAFVDRWDRRKTMIVANAVAGLVVLLPLLTSSVADVWLLILMQFLLALATRFIYPTQSAALRQLFEDSDDLLAANGLNSIVMTVGFIAGPLAAGLTVSIFGAKAAFLVDSASFLIAAAIIALKVRVPRLENAPTGEGLRAILDNIGAGIRFILVTRLLFGTIICFALLQGGLGAVNAMWVPYMRETFNLGPVEISAADMAQGIGMLFGGLMMGMMMKRLSKLALAALGLSAIGVTIAGIGIAPTFVFVMFMCLLLGALTVPGQSAFSTLMQMAIPNEMQGRVMSSFHAVNQAASLMVVALVTSLVASIPLRLIYVVAGLTTLAMSVLWTLWIRDDVRALEKRKGQADEVPDEAGFVAVPGG